MRKLFLAGAAVIALATAAPARGQLIGPGTVVFDPTAVGQLLKSVGIEGEQLTQLIETYTEIVQVYQMSTNIWNAVEKLVGADQWAPGLLNPAIRNPLPFGAADHPAWVGGFNDPSGLPFGGQYLSQNTVGGDPSVYDDGTFVGTEILKATRALSSMQAVATNHVAAIETRIGALADLFTQLGAVGKLQETASLSARLHNELNYANSQMVQAQQVQTAAQLQLAVLENNQRQWLYQDEANGISAACSNVSAAGGFVTIPACLSQ